jgi:hypothetical protein
MAEQKAFFFRDPVLKKNKIGRDTIFDENPTSNTIVAER